MRLMLTNALAALVAVAHFGCGNPERRELSQHGREVDVVVTHDGCTVYRVNYGGTAVYWAKCDGSDAVVTHDEYCGKGCVRKITTPTGGTER